MPANDGLDRRTRRLATSLTALLGPGKVEDGDEEEGGAAGDSEKEEVRLGDVRQASGVEGC